MPPLSHLIPSVSRRRAGPAIRATATNTASARTSTAGAATPARNVAAGTAMAPRTAAVAVGVVAAGVVALLALVTGGDLPAAGADGSPPSSRVLEASAGQPALAGPTGRWMPAVASIERCAPIWLPPVSAAVVDGYRPPASPYGPGNRGLEYGTELGDPVVAVAPGVVTFAGQVGGSRFVSVAHPSGLTSTYGYLEEILTAAGDQVARGQRIASARPGFHLTARVGSKYRDPTPLIGSACIVVKLVPVPEAAG